MILLLDNFDSFTYNLVDYFQQLGVACEVRRNQEPLAALREIPFTAICLSPGPETPERAGVMPALIQEYGDKVPMLGICLGHQALGVHFGARLTKAIRPMHGKLSTIQVKGPQGLFAGLPQAFSVTRYHSLVLQDLPPDLIVTAETAEKEIMAFRHRSLPLQGVQFHPEAWLTEHGLELLRNWVATLPPQNIP